MLSRCFLDFSVGVRASVIGLSQISSLSLIIHTIKLYVLINSFQTRILPRRNDFDRRHFVVNNLPDDPVCIDLCEDEGAIVSLRYISIFDSTNRHGATLIGTF